MRTPLRLNARDQMHACGPRVWAGAFLVAAVLWLAAFHGARAGDATPLCRFGVGASKDIASYPIDNMRFGWYADWGATPNASHPGGMAYLPMVRFTMTGPDSYTAEPSGAQLVSIINENRGAVWVVGNEPDRRYYQDGLEPALYARAYHDTYQQIKAVDPTARVAAGSIVQPTPLRLQYLDMVLDSYRAQFGEPMPADVWNIHTFILQEKSCDYYPEDCWGADVPPGIDAPYGMLYGIEDHDDIEIFKQFIVDFRQWMQARGYQDRPLIITEMGILLPSWLGLTADRVNSYMNRAFDYLTSASGPTGLAMDNYRYVQQWAWYSLDYDNPEFSNGSLFSSETRTATAFGDNFARYTGGIASQVNLRPLAASTTVTPRLGGGYDLRLVTRVVNNGNVRLSGPVLVRFYDGNPAAGGRQIAPDATIAHLEGCASDIAIATSGVLEGSLVGSPSVWIVVDPQNAITETDENDNTLQVRIVIPGYRLLLPRVSSARF